MLSNMGIQAIKNHIENKRHSKLINSKGFKLQSKCSSITNKRKICDSDSPSVNQPSPIDKDNYALTIFSFILIFF